MNKKILTWGMLGTLLLSTIYTIPVYADRFKVEEDKTEIIYQDDDNDENSNNSNSNKTHTRVCKNDDLFKSENKKTNLNTLTSTDMVSLDDIELCGLKGSYRVNENVYYINYNGNNNLEVNVVSLIEDMDATNYSITETPIYSQLDEESEVIGGYSYNDSIHIVGKYEDWYKVQLDNEQYGYIKNTYVAPNPLRFVREDGITKIYSGDQRVGEDLDKIYLGEFRITSYCNCVICCEQWAGLGTTASGTHVTEGRTIAVDPNVIPLGSKVEFNNNVFVAEDVGGAIKQNHIDVYIDGHQRALSYSGAGMRDVYIKVNQ